MNRFAPMFSDQELLVTVRDVARHAAPDDPLAVTQNAYDKAREPAGYEGTPKAQRIASRWRRSWKDCVALALDPGDGARAIAASKGSGLRKVMTQAEVTTAVTLVAERLGVAELSIRDYDTERDRLVREDADRWRSGAGLGGVLPTAESIVSYAGTWEQALEPAGLKAARRANLPAYPTERALFDFIADHGFAPPRRTLLEYQSRRRLATQFRGGAWVPWVTEQLARGPAATRDAPVIGAARDVPATWRDEPDTPPPPGYAPKRPVRVEMADCERDMLRALQYTEGQNLTEHLYQMVSPGLGLIGYSSMARTVKRERDITWGTFRDEMVAQRAKQARRQKRRARR